jgi:hypothetical protein
MMNPMTDEQFAALAQYEDRFRTAIDGGWCRYPGLAALQTMASVYASVTGRGIRINSGCSRCVLHVVQDAGRIFFAEKERRTAEETAKKEKTADNTAKKKTVAKRKETTKDAKV